MTLEYIEILQEAVDSWSNTEEILYTRDKSVEILTKAILELYEMIKEKEDE